MSDYKCIQPFFSSTGKQYNYGNIISSSVYYSLPPSERSKFIQNYDDDARSSSGSSYSSSNDSSWLGTDWGIGSSWGSDSSSSDSSSSDFGGFGGGDTGGGGASGDW